jgi:hypothetical protein
MTREALSLYSYFNFIKNENKMLNNYLCNYCILHFTDKNYFYSVQDVKYTDFLREKEEWLNIIKNLNENVCNFGVKGDSCLIHIDHFNPVVGILYPVNHNIDSGIFSDYLNHFLKLFFKNENNIFENNLINEFKKYSNRILKSNVNLKFNMKIINESFEKFLRKEDEKIKFKSLEVQIFLDTFEFVLFQLNDTHMMNNKKFNFFEYIKTKSGKDFVIMKKFFHLIHQRSLVFVDFKKEFKKLAPIVIKILEFIDTYKKHSLIHVLYCIFFDGPMSPEFGNERFIRFTDNNSSNVSPNFEKSNLKNLLINS